MRGNYDVEFLTEKVSERILSKPDSEQYFEQGASVEAIPKSSNSIIKEVTIEILKEDLEEAKNDSRAILLRKHVNMLLRNTVDVKKTVEYCNEMTDKLQTEYQDSYKVIQEIGSYLEKLE